MLLLSILAYAVGHLDQAQHYLDQVCTGNKFKQLQLGTGKTIRTLSTT
jgi:hypothetical protein